MAEEKQTTKRVVVEMFGQSYQLKTDEPDRLKRLAAESDRRIKEMSKKVRSFDVQRIAVLSVLQLICLLYTSDAAATAASSRTLYPEEEETETFVIAPEALIVVVIFVVPSRWRLSAI